MSVPVASVLMPVRDAQDTIAQAIASIAAQTMRDLELVVVDDGSLDATTTIALQAARDDPRIRVVRIPRQGLVPALQHGLAHCRGRWIARMDADDVAHPQRLADQIALAQAEGATVVGCLVRLLASDTPAPGMARYVEWVNTLIDHAAICREMFVESPIVHPSALVDAAALRAVGGYRDGPFPEDYDLWLRLYARGARFAKVPAIRLDWRDRPERLTRTDPRYATEAFRRLKVDALVRHVLGSRRQVQLWGAGKEGRRWLRALHAAGVEVLRVYDIDPRKIGRRLRGQVPVVPWHEVRHHRDALVLVAVGAAGARPQIRQALAAMGLHEGRDFLCVQ